MTFLGTVNRDQLLKILSNTKIGIVRPSTSGLAETFCLSAIDFGSCGIPVIGANKGGLKDTIPKKCGYRIKNKKQLYKKILLLLNNESKRQQFGNNYYHFVSSNFSDIDFTKNFMSLINNIENNNFI